jgi:hypothetical protein
MMPQPAVTGAGARAPPVAPATTSSQALPPGVQEEGEFVDVDLGAQPPKRLATAVEQAAAASGRAVERFCGVIGDVLLGCLSCLLAPCDVMKEIKS